MRPMRGGGMFGRGGPLAVSSTGAKLALGMIGATVLSRLIGGTFPIVLVPEHVVGHFAIWQLATYTLVNYPDALSVMFGGLILWSIGGALEATWGRRRLLSFAFGTVFSAGLLTVLLALVIPGLWMGPFFGGSVMASVCWVAYGLSFGRSQTNFWGMPITGNVFAMIGVGFVLLNAVFSGWLLMVPAIIGLMLTYLYVRVGTPRTFILRLRHWKLQRDLRSRSKHLKVISRDRNTSEESDRFLH